MHLGTGGGGDAAPKGRLTRCREAAKAIRLRAARLGVPHPEEITEKTSGEIEEIFELYEERERERYRRMDMLAYLIGGYVLLAVNTPTKYPCAPCGFANAAAGDDEMKRAFERMAGHDGDA